MKVNFMGTVSWFLGQAYKWFTTSDNCVMCHISQEAFVEQLFERNKLIECKPSHTPYRSGYVIDRVPHDGIDPLQKPELVKAFQQILGGLNWLTINTRPDINVTTKLLGQFNCDSSIGHLNSAKYVLRYLRLTASYGIWFTQGDERLLENIGIPTAMKDKKLLAFTESNWGAQDASAPRKDETQTMDMEEMKSIQGYYIT